MSPASLSSSGIFDTVVKNGYCVGCGMCAAASPKVEMKWTELKTFEPEPVAPLAKEEGEALAKVCPFGATSRNEDVIATDLFPAAPVHPQLGRFVGTYAGYVAAEDYRERGSSGGMGSWLAVQFLELGLVDGVIHVGQTKAGADGSPLFGFRISRTSAEIRENSKSRYYPVNLSEVLDEVRKAGEGERFAFVGIPCFVKAVRLACMEEPALKQKIKFCLGLVCGHMKSGGFAELLAWQIGIKPAELKYIDFRVKLPDSSANAYGFRAVGEGPQGEYDKISSMNAVKGGDWGAGYFKLKACEFCDDVTAETADIVVGDAWLPAYAKDYQGTNLLIVRNESLVKVLTEAQAKGSIHLEKISAKQAVDSQKSGFRHRREGLGYRLALSQGKGEWHPPKRTKSDASGVCARRKLIYRLRYEMSMKSHEVFLQAKEAGDIGVFFRGIEPVLSEYVKASSPSRFRVFASKLKAQLMKAKKAVARPRATAGAAP